LVHAASAAASQSDVGAGDTSVGVTVGDSSKKNFTVLTGLPLDGNYAIQCNGLGGSNNWLSPSGTTGVNLVSGSTGPTWTLSAIAGQQGNCYSISCLISGTTYYLQWANSGSDSTNVLLTTSAGAGTAWALDSNHILAYMIASNDPATPNSSILDGDVSAGTVRMIQLALPNSSSWSLGTFTTPPPHA
jgi:hypothetical protein